MSAPDIVARSLACAAVADLETLAGTSGAGRIGFRADIADAVLRPVSDILGAIGLSPADFGHLGDGDASDPDALQAFADTLSTAGEGVARLGPGTYLVGLDAPEAALRWSASRGGLVGRGMDRTVLRNDNPGGGRAFEFAQSCSRLYFADLTFDGGFGSGAANDLEDIVFHRCRFTTRPAMAANAMKLVADNMAGGIRRLLFVDCEFADAGRMNVEIQNHRNDGTCRYADIHFIRPRFLRAGQVATQLGMGLSLTGKGDHVTLDLPYFDGNRGPQLENAGCDRLQIRDGRIRAATAPVDVPAVSFSSRRMAYNANSQCSIDGLRLVRSVGDPGGRPALRSEMVFEASEGLELRRIVAASAADEGTNGRHVLSFGGTGTDEDGVAKTCGPVSVRDCDLSSDALNKPVIAFNSMTGTQRVAGNRIANTNASRVGPLVAAFAQASASAYTVQLAGNRMEGPVAHSAKSMVYRNNAAILAVEDGNAGLPVAVRTVTTIPAGATSGPLLDHGLPNQNLRLSARPLGPVSGGGVPFGSLHTSLTKMRANLEKAATADVVVELHLTSTP